MEYFKILELKKEPFSNSPDPEFFYFSENHWDCLQKIELAVRFKRGLNVVLGEVGTGKTTLCREFLVKLKNSLDAEKFETQVILTPDYNLPLEFLRTLTEGFGLAYEEESHTEWQLKEIIKNHLFQKAVEEGKIVVLLIDEGQKLPAFCLEQLRELLNYETNEFKLLQIVIFAQREFKKLLDEHSNFADRINLLLYLNPLSLRETKNFIIHRLVVAGSGEKIPALFNFWSYWSIWRKSGGYPRRIISLCHQIMLGMIISRKKRATPALIRAAASYLPARRTKKSRLIPYTAAAAGLALILAGYALDWRYVNIEKFFSTADKAEMESAGVAALPPPEVPASPPISPAPAAETKAPGATAINTADINPPAVVKPQAPPRTPPDILGTLTFPQSTMSEVIQQVYGSYTQRRLQLVSKYNPQIANINQVRPGAKIILPALAADTAPPREKPYCVEAVSFENLEEAYRTLTKLPDNLPPMRLITYWNARQGLVFALYLKETFYDEQSATRVLGRLSGWSPNARIIDSWDKDTIFFSTF